MMNFTKNIILDADRFYPCRGKDFFMPKAKGFSAFFHTYYISFLMKGEHLNGIWQQV
jgi:hypothetical protein